VTEQTSELVEQLTGKLRKLPDEKVREVMDFVEFLESKEQRQPQRGSAEAILRHVGGWQFEPGELEALLADIERMRDMED